MFDIKLTKTWAEDVDKDPAPIWLFDGQIFAGSVIQMSGRAKRAFKTWLAFAMTMSLSSGKKVGLFQPSGKFPTLTVEVEGARKPTRNRFQMLENGLGIKLADLDNHFMLHRQEMYLESRSHMDEICKFVRANQIKLVVLDTFAKCSNGDENSTLEMKLAMRGVKRLCDEGAAVMYLHHINKPQMKGNRDPDDEVRGSSVLAGNYDTHLALRKQVENSKSIILNCIQKDTEESFFSINWHIDKDKNSAILDMLPLESLTQVSEQSKDECVMKLLPDELYTKTALKRIWDIPTEKTEEMMELLEKEGILEKRGSKWRLT